MRIIFFLLAVCFSTFFPACASTNLVPVTDPTFTAFDSDEERQWKTCEKYEKAIAESGFLYEDKNLEEYVNAVARKLYPSHIFELIPFRIKILKDPYLNAFSLSNGAVYLHTGILAAMENEADLADILGHEMTHATNRHEARRIHNSKNYGAVRATVVLATGGIGALFAPVLTGSVYGYSRDLEREADREGIIVMEKAGYDIAESVVMFEHLKRQLEEEKVEEPFFFASHPRLAERIQNSREYVALRASQTQKGVKNSDVFQLHVKKLLLDNAGLDMEAGRYARAVASLKRYVERYPGEAEGYYLLGEANRRQDDNEHQKKAEEYYLKTLSLDAGHFNSYKMLGIIAYKNGDKTSAKIRFEKYLALNPSASDRAYIEGYIRNCEKL